MDTLIPYSGTDKYIFISYSHRDTNAVIPVISRLMAEGYRVWYDMGIDPGTEWDENIAQHINECSYFIALMSENYLASNNCKDELNYARDLEKDRLIVYLEEVNLPKGMAMRVNRLQSIFKYTYSSEEAFFQKLFTANNINSCKDEKEAPAHNAADDNINASVYQPEASQTVYTHGAQPLYTHGGQPVYTHGAQPVYTHGAQPVYTHGGQPVNQQTPTQPVEGKRPYLRNKIFMGVSLLAFIMAMFFGTQYVVAFLFLAGSVTFAILGVIRLKQNPWRVLSIILLSIVSFVFFVFLLVLLFLA